MAEIPAEKKPENPRITEKNIEKEMKESFLDYAMSVIVSRALPDVRDGLKPVHRRILYAMQDLGNFHNKSFLKCARIVGHTMGLLHPHGDLSIYDALVRMAQDFSLRYPLVMGQGNFGSIDGDPAAAMRYTEARMQKLAEELLADINKETVEFTDNYDGKMKEPVYLPSKVPNLLVNGSTGIAVGMATNIPPHNMKEICDAIVRVIDKPDLSILELFNVVKGPDFPTAGIIAGNSGIKTAYRTGRGKVIVKAKTDIEEKNGRQSIIVTEIPYQTNKALLIEQIADMIKDGKIEGVSDLRDESSRKGMRIVILLKKDANSDVTLNQLMSYTKMKSSFGINMLALVNGEPRTLNLKQLLEFFIAHRKEVVTRRSKFELREAEDKAHKLEGLQIALDHIDAVVALIKKSKAVEDAVLGLIKNFSMTEIQAKVVLEMRLQRLTSLEQDKLRTELKETFQLIKNLKELLASEKKIFDVIKKETMEIKDQYGDERKTLISKEEEQDIETEDLIEQGSVVVTITHQGYIKRLPLDTYKTQNRGGKGVKATGTKEEDFVTDVFVASTHSYLLCFTSDGKVHWIKVYEIPEASRQAKGKAIINLINIDPSIKVMAVIPVMKFEKDKYLVFATKHGTVKKTALEEYSNPRQGGIRAITFDEGDELVEVAMTSGNEEIVLASKLGNAVRFNEEDARAIGRSGHGVRGIRLDSGDEVVGMIIARENTDVLTITENGYGKRSAIEEYRLTARGGKGVINIKTSDRNGNVVAVKSVTDKDDIMFISRSGIIIRTPCANISQIGRNTQGLRLMRLNDGDKVIAAAKIVREENGNGMVEVNSDKGE